MLVVLIETQTYKGIIIQATCVFYKWYLLVTR